MKCRDDAAFVPDIKATGMAVQKRVLRNLLEIKLAQLDLLEPAGGVAKSIFSVGVPNDPIGMRYFPDLGEAETYFFDQVQKLQESGHNREDVPDRSATPVRSIRRGYK